MGAYPLTVVLLSASTLLCLGNPTCTNGVKDVALGELTVDCGGPCPLGGNGECPSCANGRRDGFETFIDCGGPDCAACDPLTACQNGAMDVNEDGVDCGGICASFNYCHKTCTAATALGDCSLAGDGLPPPARNCLVPQQVCKNDATKVCDPAAATNCGDLCVDNKCLYDAAVACATPQDPLCFPSTCTELEDGYCQVSDVTAGAGWHRCDSPCQTDADCGGVAGDCMDGVCKGTTAAECVAEGGTCWTSTCAGTCWDGIRNGAEEGSDCGGTCGYCASGGLPCTFGSQLCPATAAGAADTCVQKTCGKPAEKDPVNPGKPIELVQIPEFGSESYDHPRIWGAVLAAAVVLTVVLVTVAMAVPSGSTAIADCCGMEILSKILRKSGEKGGKQAYKQTAKHVSGKSGEQFAGHTGAGASGYAGGVEAGTGHGDAAAAAGMLM